MYLLVDGVYLLVSVGAPLEPGGHQVSGTELVRISRSGMVEAYWQAHHLAQVTRLRAYMQHFYAMDGKILRRLDRAAP